MMIAQWVNDELEEHTEKKKLVYESVKQPSSDEEDTEDEDYDPLPTQLKRTQPHFVKKRPYVRRTPVSPAMDYILAVRI